MQTAKSNRCAWDSNPLGNDHCYLQTILYNEILYVKQYNSQYLLIECNKNCKMQNVVNPNIQQNTDSALRHNYVSKACNIILKNYSLMVTWLW